MAFLSFSGTSSFINEKKVRIMFIPLTPVPVQSFNITFLKCFEPFWALAKKVKSEIEVPFEFDLFLYLTSECAAAFLKCK